MSYSSAHETSNLRSYTLEEGAPRARSRVALLPCLRPPSLPDPFSQLPRRTCASDSRKSRVRFPNGAQCHPRLQRAWSRRTHARLLAPQGGPRRLRREWDRGTTRAPAPESEELRQREHLLDPCDGRRSEL